MKRAVPICIVIAGVMSAACASAAEAYPAKPVRMIVPSIAGGNADIQARYIAERLSEALGKQFVVDNRGGAAGIIGTELAARAPADGYTVMLVANTFTVAPSLFPKLPYDSLRDFQPVSLVGEPRGCDLLSSALARHPESISLLKQAATVATGGHLHPNVLAA